MTKFIVVVFPDETKAYEGTRVFKSLHAEGALTVYGMAVVARDAKGALSVKDTESAEPLGLGVGALVGGLVGLFGGPLGAAVGMSSGALIGGMNDIFNAGVGADFARTVSDQLSPGKTAVIAEAAEDWVTPLDTRMEAIGGIVVREWRSDFEDSQIEREVAARKTELAQLKTEFTQAKAESKANVKARMDEAKAKVTAAADHAKERIQQFDKESKAQIKELQDQAAKTKGDVRAKIDQRIAEARTDYDRRSNKLKEAWELSKEALAV
jgi:uncharacterized membrane protein